MSSVRSPDSSRQRVAPAEIVLTNWPLRDRKFASSTAAAALLGVSFVAGWLSEHAGAGVVAGIALFAATWRWWIPVTFGFGPAGVSQSIFGRTFRKPWGVIAAYKKLERGVLLLPEADDTPVAALHGRYVAWLDRRDELLILLEFYLGPRSNDSRRTRSGLSR